MQSPEPSPATPLWTVDPVRPEPAAIEQAASVVRKGGVVVYPTETLYGLGADPMQEKALARVYSVKGREFTKPLPLIAASLEDVFRAVLGWNDVAERLAKAFWPGPLTLILPVARQMPSLLHAGTGQVAIRISSHPVARAFCRAAGGLIVSTSANVSNLPPFEDPAIIPPEFLATVQGVLHAGRVLSKQPSTIVDLASRPVGLIRAGVVPWQEISRVIGDEFPALRQES